MTGRGSEAETVAPAPRLARIRVYPIKSLDPVDVERAEVVENGGLAGDRAYAMVDDDGAYVNGKRTARVHRLRSRVDLDAETVRLGERGSEETREFSLDDREGLSSYLSEFFGGPVHVRHEADGGFPDDTDASGPTVISTATVREVASWYPGIDPEGVRRRFRANLEVEGVPAFWEDRLFADEGEVVGFRVGDVPFEGVGPCARCVVPTRDPDTGEDTPGFRERFVEKRRETLPPWTPSDRFDHAYRLMLNTRVPTEGGCGTIRIGDPVEIEGVRTEDG